jgi:D-arabinose 1-dehydrogenase-like Zn-dependent alcohol dehydrogenase
MAMGGAKAIIATVTHAGAMQAVSGGLGVNGVMMVIGAVGNLTVDSLMLLRKRASVKGWYSGIEADSEDMLLFSQRNGVTSMNEIFPLEQAQAAYDRMISGKARFRVVLKNGGLEHTHPGRRPPLPSFLRKQGIQSRHGAGNGFLLALE